MKMENIRNTVKENWINNIRETDDIDKLENISNNYITILQSLTNISNTLSKNDKQLDKEQPIIQKKVTTITNCQLTYMYFKDD